jgi:hypothetical protein
LNWYDLYRKVYPGNINLASSAEELAASREGFAIVDGEVKTYRKGFTQAEYTPWVKHMVANPHHVMGNGITEYLNREDVRKVLHIPSSAPGWSQCANIDYHTQTEAS